ncbi:uncharacterized protein LOC124152555 [Haliotis rufescens]|uniref:uncharacterized protein LOC124152555 n=1 Tax=Haliotis rufescens TaxID=6454 RepID=UPI00201F2E6B|nr:uncharacterized protein LOC124152555 [Haliotis rufescens]
MSDSSSDTSVGSSPYQSDREEITFVMVGEDTNTDSGDTCTRHSDDSNTVRLEEEENKPSLDRAGCSTDTLQGSIIRLEEENIQLKKRIEELEYFNRLSLASGDSGFRSETSSLASLGRGPTTHRRQEDKVGHVGKKKDNLKRRFNPRPQKHTDEVFRPTSVLRVGNEGEQQMPNATEMVAEPVHGKAGKQITKWTFKIIMYKFASLDRGR